MNPPQSQQEPLQSNPEPSENPSELPPLPTAEELVSRQAIGLLKKSNTIRRPTSISASIRKKTNFYTRYRTTAAKVVAFKLTATDSKKSTGEGKNSRLQKTMTKPEVYLFDTLLDLGFELKREFKMHGKYYDVFLVGLRKAETDKEKELHAAIKKLKILIEMDGDYWHGKEESELTMRQLKQRVEDSYKDAIAMAKDFELIRIWESDVNITTIKYKLNHVLIKHGYAHLTI